MISDTEEIKEMARKEWGALGGVNFMAGEGIIVTSFWKHSPSFTHLDLSV